MASASKHFQGLLGVAEELRCHGDRADDLVSALIFGRADMRFGWKWERSSP